MTGTDTFAYGNDKLVVTAQVNVLGGTLDSANAVISLDFGKSLYIAELDLSLFSGVVRGEVRAVLNRDELLLLGTVTYQVPYGWSDQFDSTVVRWIAKKLEGTTFAGAVFALDIDFATLSQSDPSSYFAVWMNVFGLTRGWKRGFDGSDTFLDGDDVSQIKADIEQNTSGYFYSAQATVLATDDATAISFDPDWTTPVSDLRATVILPDGTQLAVGGSDRRLQLVAGTRTSCSTMISSARGQPQLPTGQYTLVLHSPAKTLGTTGTAADATYIVKLATVPPNVHVSSAAVSGNGTLNVSIGSLTSVNATQPMVSVFVGNAGSPTTGRLVGKFAVTPGKSTTTFGWPGFEALPLDQYVVHATLDDGAHPIVMSNAGGPVQPPVQLQGVMSRQATGAFGMALGGYTVFLDLNGNGEFDAPSSSSPGEPFTITDAMGRYWFTGLPAYTTTLGVLLPVGVGPGSPNRRSSSSSAVIAYAVQTGGCGATEWAGHRAVAVRHHRGVRLQR